MKPDTIIRLKIAALFATLLALYPLLAYAQTKINLATQVQGTLPVTNGGTGFASITADRIPYATASNTLGTAAGLTYDGTTFTTGTATVSTGALTVTGGTITTGATTSLSLATTGGTQAKILSTASANRWVTLTGSNGGNPTLGVSAGSLAISAPVTIGTNPLIAGKLTDMNQAVGPPGEGEGSIGASVTNGLELIGDGSTNDLLIYNGGGTARLEMSTAGAFRWNAYGAGALTTDASGNITAASDARAKRNIRPFARGLADILPLNPILYGYAPDSGLDQTRDDYAGFDAANVQKTIPEAVGRNPDDKDKDGKITRVGFLTLNPFVILAAMVNAVKEMHAEIQSLRARVAALEAR